MTDECLELKTIKYRTMLLNGNNEEVKETVENVSSLDSFLDEKQKKTLNEPWIKINKTTKLLKFQEYVNKYALDNKLLDEEKNDLFNFLSNSLDRKKIS